MFKRIVDKMDDIPKWAGEGTRWRRLIVLDRLLDGTFYDHLTRAFYEESINANGQQMPIPLEDRRPSTQYRLPRYVARWASRKLFAGRHAPKIRSPNAEVEQRITELLTNTQLWNTMYTATYRGSVGSVAVTFRTDGKNVGLKVWRAAWCSPRFDDFGELAALRVHYCTTPAALRALGYVTEDMQGDYWFIRDFGPDNEVTYTPVRAADWNPVNGFEMEPERRLVPCEEVWHGLGFVPGIWVACPGGDSVDGPGLWEDAIPDVIELDYLLSQAARGSRYNCAPQLVTKGLMLQEAAQEAHGGIMRGPTTTLRFMSDQKDPQGNVTGSGDAHLLEMTGTGTEAALKVVSELHKMALEQVGVMRKDPSEMPGPLSGRAMEFLDEDAHDVVMLWRTVFGDGGALPLVCKVLKALDADVDVTGLWLQWPRIYLPTPGDLQNITTALVQASTPTAPQGVKPAEDGSLPLLAPLLDRETAERYFRANLDLGILDATADGPASGPVGGDPAPDGGGLGDGEDQGTLLDKFFRVYKPLQMRLRNPS